MENLNKQSALGFIENIWNNSRFEIGRSSRLQWPADFDRDLCAPYPDFSHFIAYRLHASDETRNFEYRFRLSIFDLN